MKVPHNFKKGDIGTHENIPCEIISVVDELTIEIYGMFGKEFYPEFYFKNTWHQLLGIRSFRLKELQFHKTIEISFRDFVPSKTQEKHII